MKKFKCVFCNTEFELSELISYSRCPICKKFVKIVHETDEMLGLLAMKMLKDKSVTGDITPNELLALDTLIKKSER